MQKRFSLPMAAVLTFGFFTSLVHAAPPEIAPDQVQSCVTSLCGGSKANISNSFVGDNLANIKSREAVAMSNILKEDIRSLVKQQIQLEKDRVKALEVAFKDPSPVKVSEKVKELMVLLVLTQEVFQNFSSLAFVGGPKGVEINETGFKAYTAAKTPAERAALRAILDKVAPPAIDLALASTKGSGFALKYHLSKTYPNLSLTQALAIDSRYISMRVQKIVNYFDGVLGKTAGMEKNDVLLAQAAAGQDLNASEMDEYIKMYVSITAVANILDKSFAATLRLHPISLENEMRKFLQSDFLEKRKKEVVAIDPHNIDAVVAETCSAYMRISFDGNTSALRIRKFQPIIQEITSAAEAVALRFVDKNDQAHVVKLLSQIQFSFPTTNEARLGEIRAVLNAETVKLGQQRSELSEGNRSLLLVTELLDKLNKKNETLYHKLTTESALMNACNSLPFGAATDNAVTLTGKISVSWYSLAFPDRGTGILAHELGHVISSFIRDLQVKSPSSQSRFSESLSCVANRNPFVTGKFHLSAKDNSTWSEEDWADHFAVLVMDELAARKSSAAQNVLGVACALMSHQKDYQENKLAPAEKDTHSSGLLRLLMFAKDSNQMTSQCQKIVDQFASSTALQCR